VSALSRPGGTKEHLKRLNLRKEWISQEKSTFELLVDEKPMFAGIDPYNKLYRPRSRGQFD
jgi:hypothetical protein